MKRINDYSDFMLDLILERNSFRIGPDHLPLVISERLEKLLKQINHPIAKKLLASSGVGKRESSIITFIDLDKTSDNKFTISDSNKAFHIYAGRGGSFGDGVMDMEYLSHLDIRPKLQKYDPKLDNDESARNVWKYNRIQTRIGSVINKLFPNEFKQGGYPSKDVESFVQEVVARRSKMRETKGKGFKIIIPPNISKYYDESTYDIVDRENNQQIKGSTLANSCMRFEYCKPFTDYYDNSKNVNLLVLFSDIPENKDKIVGRALIWDLEKPKGRKFMDRVYYRYETDLALFKLYAEEKGYLYKKRQNSDANVQIYDPISKQSKVIYMKTPPTFKKADHYPYMDTLKFFNIDKGYLTNDDDTSDGDTFFVLEDTAGGHEHGGETLVYVDYYGTSYDENDLKFCELGSDWRTFDDATWIQDQEKYATEEYLSNNMVWCDYEQTYYDKDKVVWSVYNDSYINIENSIQMHENDDSHTIDKVRPVKDSIRHKESGNVIDYNADNGETYYFDNDMYKNPNFVLARMDDKKNGEQQFKHKVWDKDKLFRHVTPEERHSHDRELRQNKGVPNPHWMGAYWYYESDNTMKNRITGQKSMFGDETS